MTQTTTLTPVQLNLLRQLENTIYWEAPKMTNEELKVVIAQLYQYWGL